MSRGRIGAMKPTICCDCPAPLKQPEGSGRPRVRCPECTVQHRARKVAERYRSMHGVKPRAERLLLPRPVFIEFACFNCGTFKRRRTRAPISAFNRYCSRRCQQADMVDALAVFKRDDWRCHLCSKKTKRHLRGTYAPLAPELDHVIPLALGGRHTYDNVKCACRACNGEKNATTKGQLGLVLVRAAHVEQAEGQLPLLP